MKTQSLISALFVTLCAGLLLVAGAIRAFGQETNSLPVLTPPTAVGAFTEAWSDLKSATNFAVAPYVTYGLDNHKVGGGALVLYNFNNYVGGGIGVDYVDQFSLISGNLELKLPMRPLSFIGVTNFVATPFTFAGFGTPFSTGGATNVSVSTHLGFGANVDVAKFWGGTFGVGAAYITRSGAGSVYDGKYVDAFVSWRRGF